MGRRKKRRRDYGGPCRHCQTRQAANARGLCSTCAIHYTPIYGVIPGSVTTELNPEVESRIAEYAAAVAAGRPIPWRKRKG